MCSLLALAMILSVQNSPLVFEVVSVRPGDPIATGGQRGANGVPGGVFNVEGHRFTAKAVTLYNLIKGAMASRRAAANFGNAIF